MISTLDSLADKFISESAIDRVALIRLLSEADSIILQKLAKAAGEIKLREYGSGIFVRGLIEFTSYCKNDCIYCGLRRSNTKAERYRLSSEEILKCCELAHEKGFKTFVLQGGEDGFYSDSFLIPLISALKEKYPDTAITLSLGERPKDSYKRLFDAGADRYLLRHETIDSSHYAKLHPSEMTLASRVKALQNLKEIGYQVGTGFMVGSPYQTFENLADDILFIKDFKPAMIGIGPFIPHKDTPFKDFPSGSPELTVLIIAILRILLPKVLLPATTALNTLASSWRDKALISGANVLMPNISPFEARKKYSIYNDKVATGEEGGENLELLAKHLKPFGCVIDTGRGDSLMENYNQGAP
ncbi:MAG: [FeFe] hydrogenase H-cluster radical SAM maturase HydE [Candidatus Riflebacteria bacterium]|nr:[FeFe] hydrogenase H-cluster radical SAM maturase HydE [Candidatus Riflebacteria bacterium]